MAKKGSSRGSNKTAAGKETGSRANPAPSKKKSERAQPEKTSSVGKETGRAVESTDVPVATTVHPTGELGFPVVGMGASAGGLEALEAFFDAMPADAGVAFVVVSHLDPTHISLLPELLQKHTRMSVRQIEDGMRVEGNSVYVIPPNNSLDILRGTLHLRELDWPRGSNLPIDSFFRSLAQDQEHNAVCIILSGTGTDGTLGVKAIKGRTGMVMVQNEDSAKHGGMPRSAVNTGLVDYILAPAKMPDQLLRYIAHASKTGVPSTKQPEGPISQSLQKIYAIIRARNGHDFSLYKRKTICRRIERRMNVHQINDIADYVRYLQESDREPDILFRELLIGVTSFFRDPEAFQFLQTQALPDMLAGKPNDYVVRVWVPGCASGEEAYSLAITLQECMEAVGRHFHVQIFGTDIDELAIDVARAGIYPASIAADVTPERLRRFFTRDDDGQYRVKKAIREMLVFAPQDVIRDPPFTKLNLLSCRNLLIYFGAELQRKLLPAFHYSLKPNGLLFLGSSETIGPSTDLFSAVQKKWKLFRRKPMSAGEHHALNLPVQTTSRPARELDVPNTVGQAEEISELQLVETILRQSNTPPCAIINDANDVVYIHGRTGRFLEPAEGRSSVNLLEMARPGLKKELVAAIRHVTTYKQETTRRGLQVQHEGGRLSLSLTARPILDANALRGLIMIVFEETPADTAIKAPPTKHAPECVAEIEQELEDTRESLQTTVEELETSNEELKSTNEELQSTNEELQSTNEELETSKEELQSLNEESATVNAELQARIDELSQTNDDLKNLLDSTEIATVFLDTNLRVRRFTPRTTAIIPLTTEDKGRPLRHLATTLIDVDISEYARRVLEDLAVREVEVETNDDRILVMRARPYRTTANLIDGVVVTFDDVTENRKATRDALASQQCFRMFFEQAGESMLLVELDSGKIVEFNQQTHKLLGYTREEFAKLTIPDIDAEASGDGSAQHVEQVLKLGRDAFRTKRRAKDGRLHDVELETKSICIGDKQYLLSTWREISSADADG